MEGVPHLAARLRDADPGLLRQPVVEQPAEPALAGYLDHDLDAVAVLARIGGLGDRSYQLDDATRIGTREHHPVRHAAMVSGGAIRRGGSGEPGTGATTR